MEFCEFCNNMYYIKEQENKKITYFCKNCGSEKDIDQDNAYKQIVFNDFKNVNTKYLQYLNHNIIHDHTIPHVNNIKCTNMKCTKTDKQDNDVMYIKYDNVNIQFLYYCVHCKYFWTNN
jgi:DNA-directed RNA polymerase subunit M/transcription elongation factor TFIIS